MNEWNIQSRAHACQACGKSFADKEHYHTILSDEKSEFMRQDVCLACWTAQYGLGAQDRKGFISHWQGVYEAPPAAPPEPIKKETAETLLRKLLQLNDPKYGPAAFILAVMLERKRLLRVKEQVKREGARLLIYEQPKTGDILMVTDPGLQLNQLEQVQRDVADLLENGLPAEIANPPAPPAAPAETPAETAAPGETAPPTETAAQPENSAPAPAAEPAAAAEPASTEPPVAPESPEAPAEDNRSTQGESAS